MAERITELEQLRREVQETKWLVYGVLQALVGKKQTDDVLGTVQSWVSGERFTRGTSIMDATPEHSTVYCRFLDADLYTLEEVAAKPRKEIAAMEGVGRITMRHIEDAMSERGLEWAEVA